MKAFHTIAIPHKDILEGNLTLDVFAADLHEVSLKRGPDEYKDPEIFFQKTYLTTGLKNILTIVEKRLSGKGGDPIIQLQTPFGGGKTHSLIAIYHKSKEWKAKTVVIVGEKLEPTDTLWGVIEKQLTGKIQRFKDNVAPGSESFKELLEAHQPLVILMDEVLQYVTRAAGVKVEGSNLGAQAIAFMKSFTEVITTIPKTTLLLSLPSSVPEHYDENAERLFSQLQKVSGRVEKIYTPVEESEITKIIRRRLFSSINEDEAAKVVKHFVDYIEKENLLPQGLLASEYREQFLSSYPFIPDVVDVLYKRWGTFPQFQRTRGVLRILAQVIASVKSSNKSYITLADFNLANQDLRQDLIKHIDSTFNGVIASDITDKSSGAVKVNDKLGSAYQGLLLGSRTATTIFMYSHSGGSVKGATVPEVKRSATTTDNISAVIDSAFDELEKELFFMQKFGDKYFFSNQPNLNKILLTHMDNIKDQDLEILEKELLQEKIKGNSLKVYLWEDKSSNIADDESLKLIILKKDNKEIISDILKKKGNTPRTKSNTLFCLYPSEMDRGNFTHQMKKKIAYDLILKAPNLNLSTDQRKEIKKELDKLDTNLFESLRKYYRMVAVPSKDEFKIIDLGVPTYGETKSLVDEVYDKLVNDEEILERVAPVVLKTKYLKNNDFVSTAAIYQSTLSTPGEFRLSKRSTLENSIIQGVQLGLFGLGILIDDKPICNHFKQSAMVYFDSTEILIKDTICIEQKKKPEPESGTQSTGVPQETPAGEKEIPTEQPKQLALEQLSLNFTLPKGKVSSLMGILTYLQTKYENLEFDISASNGKLTKQEYEDKIEEALRQIGINLKEKE
jgi:hypothetical protein